MWDHSTDGCRLTVSTMALLLTVRLYTSKFPGVTANIVSYSSVCSLRQVNFGSHLKMTWDFSNLLEFLKEKSVSATFFVVGSRVIEYPGILINEYMAGHEIRFVPQSESLSLLTIK